MESMKQPDILDKLKKTVSQERIREEITKMMMCDTIKTMKLLVDIDRDYIKGFLNIVFKDTMWLKPTKEISYYLLSIYSTYNNKKNIL